MSLPENHVVAEGRTLLAAREAAAAQLGVSVGAVEHKLDLAHFKASGSSGASTVKIFAWERVGGAPEPVAAPRREAPAPRREAPAPWREPAREQSREPAREAAAPRGSSEGQEAAIAAQAWMKGLLDAMGREAVVQAEMNGDTVVVFVDAKEAARHLVGRQGTTLRAIEHLLGRTLAATFPSGGCRIDVARPDDGGDRMRDERGPRRDDRGGRDDRGPRRDDRGPRRDDRMRDERGPRFSGGRDDRGDRPRRNDGDALKSLARKLAEKVVETGEPEVIRRELNSFDRRLVHLEVAEIAGVASRSVGEGAERRVEIYVPQGGENTPG